MKLMDMLRKITRRKNDPIVQPIDSRVNVDINYVESKLTPEDLKTSAQSGCQEPVE